MYRAGCMNLLFSHFLVLMPLKKQLSTFPVDRRYRPIKGIRKCVVYKKFPQINGQNKDNNDG